MQRRKKTKKEGDDIAAIAFFFFFATQRRRRRKVPSSWSWSEEETRKETRRKKLDAYLGPALAPAWVSVATALLLEAPFQALAPSSLAPSSPPSSPLQACSGSTSLELWRWSEGGRGW